MCRRWCAWLKVAAKMGGRGEKQKRPQEVGDGFISDRRAAVRLPQITRASGGRWKAERCFGKSISSCCFPASLSKAALAAAGCDFAGKINVGWPVRAWNFKVRTALTPTPKPGMLPITCSRPEDVLFVLQKATIIFSLCSGILDRPKRLMC